MSCQCRSMCNGWLCQIPGLQGFILVCYRCLWNVTNYFQFSQLNTITKNVPPWTTFISIFILHPITIWIHSFWTVPFSILLHVSMLFKIGKWLRDWLCMFSQIFILILYLFLLFFKVFFIIYRVLHSEFASFWYLKKVMCHLSIVALLSVTTYLFPG